MLPPKATRLSRVWTAGLPPLAMLVFKGLSAVVALQIWVARTASQGHTTAGVCVDACDPYYYWGPCDPCGLKESRLSKPKGYAELAPPFTGRAGPVPPHMVELILFLTIGVGEPPDAMDVGEGATARA